MKRSFPVALIALLGLAALVVAIDATATGPVYSVEQVRRPCLALAQIRDDAVLVDN